MTRKFPPQSGIARVAFIALAAVVLMGAVAVYLVRFRDPTTVSVAVSVKVCPPSSSDCYQLPVPNAEVLVQGKNFKALADTDSSGVAKFRVPGAGAYTATARSFVIKGTELEGRVDANLHETKTIDLIGELVPDATEGGRQF
ncbi:hypothetical protein [Actinoplanes sp. NPDC049316]|uniref:hypothetical protein n=1 Tax=Actinoplanes sp. NPDC049316 TaxID=3154727 RepID=UPI0034435A56